MKAQKARPKPKSSKTMKHYRDMLAVLFKYAIQWDWTGSSPLDGVNRITKIRNERMRYLSDAERFLIQLGTSPAICECCCLGILAKVVGDNPVTGGLKGDAGGRTDTGDASRDKRDRIP
jgi:hypothetical protein